MTLHCFLRRLTAVLLLLSLTLAAAPAAVAADGTPAARTAVSLKNGSDPAQVKLLQAALNKVLGLDLTVDGKWGSKTKKAVSAFQKQYALNDTGTADPGTLTLLYVLAGTEHDALLECAVMISPEQQSIRSSAKSNAAAVVKLQPGASVTVIAREGNWALCAYHGKWGYIRSDLLRTIARPAPILNLANVYAPVFEDGEPLDMYLQAAFSQVGFMGGTTDAPILNGLGSGGSWSKYGECCQDPSEAYCSYFVGWCARQVGIPETAINDARDVDGLFFDAQDRFVYFFTPGARQTQGLQLKPEGKTERKAYTPQPGDLVYYRWSGAKDTTTFSHIGIVYAVDHAWVYTIEGNVSGCVDTRMFRKDDTAIVGYARPDYSLQESAE